MDLSNNLRIKYSLYRIGIPEGSGKVSLLDLSVLWVLLIRMTGASVLPNHLRLTVIHLQQSFARVAVLLQKLR